jgi:hypothetical protein
LTSSNIATSLVPTTRRQNSEVRAQAAAPVARIGRAAGARSAYVTATRAIKLSAKVSAANEEDALAQCAPQLK